MKGLECPWCNYSPKKGEPKFPVIKTIGFTKTIQRGRLCPKCGKSFVTVEKVIPQTFFKKESDGYKGISEAAS